MERRTPPLKQEVVFQAHPDFNFTFIDFFMNLSLRHRHHHHRLKCPEEENTLYLKFAGK